MPHGPRPYGGYLKFGLMEEPVAATLQQRKSRRETSIRRPSIYAMEGPYARGQRSRRYENVARAATGANERGNILQTAVSAASLG